MTGPRIRGWGTKPIDVPAREPRPGRLTLDFSGSMLPLPSELPESTPGTARPTDTVGHDAWTLDQVRRSTPPPMQTTPGWLQQGMDQRPRRPSSMPPPGAAAGSAFDLVDATRPSLTGVDLHTEMAERFSLGDFSGALGVAELILGTRGDDPVARKYAQSCREKLEQFYVSRIGSLSTGVRVSAKGRDRRWLGLDHRAGFLVSRIEGETSVDDLLDVSGMPRLEALRTLADLLDAGAVELVVDDGRRPR